MTYVMQHYEAHHVHARFGWHVQAAEAETVSLTVFHRQSERSK